MDQLVLNSVVTGRSRIGGRVPADGDCWHEVLRDSRCCGSSGLVERSPSAGRARLRARWAPAPRVRPDEGIRRPARDRAPLARGVGTAPAVAVDEQDEEDDEDHALAASARAWCSRIRHEGPLMLKTIARCMSRSRMAEATTASPNTSPQAGRPRLVVASVG